MQQVHNPQAHTLGACIAPLRAVPAFRSDAAGAERRGNFARLASDGQGGMRELLSLLGVDEVDSDLGMDIPAPVRRLHEGDTLFHEGAQADGIYFVRAGTFKTFCTGEDGYEQVLGFSGRGELLGFDAIGMGHYANQVVALEESSVYVVLLRDYFSVTPRSPAFDRAVFRAVSDALKQRGELADMMAAVAAEVRLSRFLVHLSRRMAASGLSSRRFHLRMSRRDIASYLGVAHETVSRSFTSLVGAGLVRVNNREVEILDMPGLKVFSSGTRRQVDDGARCAATRSTSARACVQPLAA